MKVQLVVVLVSLTVLCLIVDYCSATAECTFLYVRQPPLTTIQDCNPYGGSTYDSIMIAMECTVRTEKNLSDTFEIRWFREDTTTHNLGIGERKSHRDGKYNNITSRYDNTHFFNQLNNTSFLGKYWCQVINTTADPDQPLMRSNVFTLLPPTYYTYKRLCSSKTPTQSMDNETCADTHTIDQISTCISKSATRAPQHYDASSSPTEKVIAPLTVTAGVIGGVLLLLILLLITLGSMLVVILITKKRRKTQNISNTAIKATGSTVQHVYTSPSNSSHLKDNSNKQFEVLENIPSQTVVYTVPNKTRARNTEKKEVFIGEYCFLGDVTTNTVLHSEDAITKGADNMYSKLGHGLAPTTNCDTNRLPSCGEQEYSSITHQSSHHTNDDAPVMMHNKLSHNDTTLQQYSSLDHHSMQPTTQVDADKVTYSTEQRYSSLQHHTMSPNTHSDKMSHTVTSDQHLYSVLKLETQPTLA